MEAGLALEDAVALLERSLDGVREARERGLLPHVTEDGRWELLSPLDEEGAALTGLPWTGGFVAGQLWLASRLPRREHLALEARAATELIAPRAAQPTTHDLGFLFWPSAVLGYLATGEERLRELGLQAASSLMQRALPSGVIQVIGPLDDPGYRGRVIVDTHPNLMLLWWADREGLEGAASVAATHIEATRALFRPDGSTYHAARFGDDGAVSELGTINGYSRDSTWARGQAWAIHGLVSAHRATGEPELLAAAERSARWFLERLPADGIPPWDFDAPPGPKDASSAAIVASALLDLGWDEEARGLLLALVERCLNRGEDDGLLLHCCYRYPARKALDSATAWGDFFFLDALVHAAEPRLQLGPLEGRLSGAQQAGPSGE
jgi:unsaturated chondroitin disaccharide hydrolase